MVDPLSEVIGLLRPRAVFTKGISGAGRWGVRYADFGHPSFAVVIEGACLLAVDGQPPLTLEAGDFVLLPSTPGFTMTGFEPVVPTLIDLNLAAAATEEVRHGRQDGPPDLRMLGGYFLFDGEDSGLLVSLLPAQVHVRGVERLSVLVKLLIEEAAGRHSGRDLVLTRLIEILLVESLRQAQTPDAPAGLLRGSLQGLDRIARGQVEVSQPLRCGCSGGGEREKHPGDPAGKAPGRQHRQERGHGHWWDRSSHVQDMRAAKTH